MESMVISPGKKEITVNKKRMKATNGTKRSFPEKNEEFLGGEGKARSFVVDLFFNLGAPPVAVAAQGLGQTVQKFLSGLDVLKFREHLLDGQADPAFGGPVAHHGAVEAGLPGLGGDLLGRGFGGAIDIELHRVGLAKVGALFLEDFQDMAVEIQDVLLALF